MYKSVVHNYHAKNKYLLFKCQFKYVNGEKHGWLVGIRNAHSNSDEIILKPKMDPIKKAQAEQAFSYGAQTKSVIRQYSEQDKQNKMSSTTSPSTEINCYSTPSSLQLKNLKYRLKKQRLKSGDNTTNED
jgi:hypothetical protein